MASFIEKAIHNYSGLASETKPTIAAGNTVPNGSRWREVDTGKTYFFNLSDDTWNHFSAESFSDINKLGLMSFDLQSHVLLNEVIVQLKILNLHMQTMTEDNIGGESVD